MSKIDVVIDIETVTDPVTVEDVQSFMEEYTPPANYKTEEAIAKHRKKTESEAIEKIRKERAFHILGKRMVSCALGIADINTGQVAQVESWQGDDLSIITHGIVAYLNQFKEYRLIGWNHVNFDLPEVIKSFAKTRVRPRFRPLKWDVIDLCNKPFYRTSLKDAVKAFGLGNPELDGSAVASLYEAGDWETIKSYNEQDVVWTGQLYCYASTLFTF